MVTRREFVKLCLSTVIATGFSELLEDLSTISEASYREIPVLLYHRIGYTNGYLTITPEKFAADMQILTDYGYHTIPLSLFEKFLIDGNVELPERPMLITFDDGYADNYEYAFPILQKQQMTAVFYIIAGLLGQPDRVSAEHIRAMAGGGMQFGSHTMTHRALGELPESEIRDELQTSKNILENVLSSDIRTIAYPRGSYNQETLRIAKELGYVGGLTTRNGKCTRQADHFVLNRIPLFSYDQDILAVIARRGRGEPA
ncbi:polysaccharide deacetylase family protein [Anaerospora sp.]|uniref:polysaccharide deacetylase family protein n=1 Tax=Anaerospora sp. TaxID=1960278 RepID=UPI002897AE6F|nr:polysaccharide deacetylase family protein [Anaerospora sp.]